ncbi:hypothetical protein [Streptomyces niveus]|uniref:hypothetical protein n=1 Tax=Streptomyces niveus TaxID=193462 RepID=UPI0033B41F6A
MPDRRHRTALHVPQPTGPVLLLRERQSSSAGSTGPEGPSGPDGTPGPGGPSGSSGSSGSGSSGSSGSGSSGSGSSDDNPFAPPPEDRPDQPWQPRHPQNGDGSPDDQSSGGDRSSWGSQWSSRQPGRSSGGFGGRPGGQNTPGGGQNGPGGRQDGPDGQPGRGKGGLRWDPTDPFQRRARYALLSGMWAFFFALFDFPEIALLLGALALYWGISSLRAKAPVSRASVDGPAAAGTDVRTASGSGSGSGTTSAAPATTDAPPAPGTPPGAPAQGTTNKPQTTAAVSGIVTAGIALLIVAATFTVQLVYRDYYTCVNDALTKTGQLACNDKLPDSLVPIFGVQK